MPRSSASAPLDGRDHGLSRALALPLALPLTLALTLALTLTLAPGLASDALAKKAGSAENDSETALLPPRSRAKSEGSERKESRRAARANLAKTLDKKMKGSNGYGLIGARLLFNYAGISQAREGDKDKLISSTSDSGSLGFGLTFDRAFNRIVGVRAEALFQNKNFSHKSPEEYSLLKTPTKKDTETYLDYIEVPVGIVTRFNYGQLIRPYATAGLYVALLVNADGLQEGDNKEARKPFTSFDAGWFLGGGSLFVLGEDAGFLGAELRYTRGLANIADTDVEADDKSKPLQNQIYTMSSLSLSVSYHF
jgi:hypothetical protein